MPTDVPIKSSEYLRDVLNAEMDPPPSPPFSRWTNSSEVIDLESVQVLLHLEGMETNVVLLRRDYLDDDDRIPFHNEILEHWQKFARVQAKNELEVFQIADITLPLPHFFRIRSCPFFKMTACCALI